MSLLNRRSLMMNMEDEEEVSWKTLYEEELTEDKNIILDGFECNEVEAYIISEAYEETSNIYLTSSSGGNVYGEPRVFDATKTTNFIMKLSLKVVTPYLWEVGKICAVYYSGSNFSGESKSYGHSYANLTLNKEKITEISLVNQAGTLKAGTKVYVRGR